jgi:hypothetical protein
MLSALSRSPLMTASKKCSTVSCGPLCNQSNDLDCACVPTHSKEKRPRCRDNIDNDCDGLVDKVDPDC